jgi:hypothetical protein
MLQPMISPPISIDFKHNSLSLRGHEQYYGTIKLSIFANRQHKDSCGTCTDQFGCSERTIGLYDKNKVGH